MHSSQSGLTADPEQVHLKDGRELVGELQCVEKQRNLILSQTFQLLRDRCSSPRWHGSRSVLAIVLGKVKAP